MLRRILPFMAVAPLLAGAAVAQEPAASGPPKVIAISREDIKPGRMGPHEKVAAAFVSAISKTPSRAYRIGLTPVSGDENVVLYLSGFSSFADVEAQRKEIENISATNAAFKAELAEADKQGVDMHASQRTAYYIYRPDLSYHARSDKDIPHVRYFNISTTRTKPGRAADYVEYIKSGNAAAEKGNIEGHRAVYQVVSGAPSGTFVTITALDSLKQLDDNYAKADANAKAMSAALGGDDVMKQRRMLVSEVVIDTVGTVYAINPTISRPTEQQVAGDPEFWKPAAQAQTASKQTSTTKRATAKEEKHQEKPKQ